ncbi:hypothetical protein [Bacteroides acidifaciens]|uniref:hypothetical protein n=1 Tax=Bacteroides acidifaciens TaxID=85831 RepID=UPI0015888AF3|nr:hypothetical protein [Bacteroides acidifaciens]MDE6820260.1 hypothetical protein [Bacteroides acidifaciens]MDE6986278.1 hypothetical protein [Bacteroides acidifaciens]
MKKVIFNVFVVCCSFITAIAQTGTDEISVMARSLNNVQSKQAEFDKKLRLLITTSTKNKHDIQVLEQRNEVLCVSIDSLKTVCDSLQKAQAADRTTINGKIQETNNTLSSTQSIVKNRTLWGGIITIAILFAVSLISYYLIKRIKRGTSSIDDVRKVQEVLQNAQNKMQEESVKLDNQLLEIVQQQLQERPIASGNTGMPDHSLVVKLADEIARIETNLSKMDKSVRGYKQLLQAKDRMINNVRANGYEIISLLGHEYNDGMQFQTRFVPDDTLPEGKRIITGMIKMQVNYNGEMIQPAEIVVSQNI